MKSQFEKPDINEVAFKYCAALALVLILLYYLPYPLSTQSRQNEALSGLLKDCNRIEIVKNPPWSQSGNSQTETRIATLSGAAAEEFTKKIRLNGKRILLLGDSIKI